MPRSFCMLGRQRFFVKHCEFSAWFVRGAWLAPFMRRGGATNRIANSPVLWGAAASVFMCECPIMPTGLAGRS